MQLPPIDKSLLAKMGIPGTAVPIKPVFDLGLDIARPKQKVEKPLTLDDCMRLFGTKDAVMMNLLPQFLTAIAIEQAEAYIKYCSDNKLSDFKRHNREMRKCIKEYYADLRSAYGTSWRTYQIYLERLRETVDIDLFKCWCTFTNEASRQYISYPHREIPARVTFIRMLLTFVEEYDKNIDKLIASRLHLPCERKQNPYSFLISVLCIDIAETFGIKLEINNTMVLCVKVLANRCRQVVKEIMRDEDHAEIAQS